MAVFEFEGVTKRKLAPKLAPYKPLYVQSLPHSGNILASFNECDAVEIRKQFPNAIEFTQQNDSDMQMQRSKSAERITSRGYERVPVTYTLAVTSALSQIAVLESKLESKARGQTHSPSRWLYDLRKQLEVSASDWNGNANISPTLAKEALIEALGKQAAMCILAIHDLEKNK